MTRASRCLAYTNGFVYGVSEIQPSGSSVPEIEWFKIDVSNPKAPTLAAQGQITRAAIGAGVGVFNPSIAGDAAGDVLVNFTASGANMYPADYYAYEVASDTTFSAPAPYQSSTGYFDSGVSGLQPWGNYSTAIVDPNNPRGFWISNEYVASNWWQTAAAQVSIGAGAHATVRGPVGDSDKGPEAPVLAIAQDALNVNAGGDSRCWRYCDAFRRGRCAHADDCGRTGL